MIAEDGWRLGELYYQRRKVPFADGEWLVSSLRTGEEIYGIMGRCGFCEYYFDYAGFVDSNVK